MSNIELIALVKEIKQYKIMQDEIKQELEKLEDLIKSEMEHNQVEKMIVGEYKVNYTTVKSSRFDSTTFKEDNPDIYTAYTVESISRRFTVS